MGYADYSLASALKTSRPGGTRDDLKGQRGSREMEPQCAAGFGYHGERTPSGHLACVQGSLYQVVREGWGVDRQSSWLLPELFLQERSQCIKTPLRQPLPHRSGHHHSSSDVCGSFKSSPFLQSPVRSLSSKERADWEMSCY